MEDGEGVSKSSSFSAESLDDTRPGSLAYYGLGTDWMMGSDVADLKCLPRGTAHPRARL